VITTAPTIAHVRFQDYRLAPVSGRRWRVLDASGRAIGHISVRGDDSGPRFVAERFRVALGGFVDLGSFWHIEDAVTVLHDSR
jgi:hypothetical protein